MKSGSEKPPSFAEQNLDRRTLGEASARGLVINFGAQGTKLALNLLVQILLARLLSPRDFGLVAMAAPFQTLTQMFADFGLSQATVQRAQISEDQSTLLFWINVGICILLAILGLAIAPLVGWFYGEPRVAPIVAALSGLLLLSGLRAQHIALLNRRLAFARLAIIDLISLICGAVAGVTAALSGFGVWALIINQAVSSAGALILAWVLASWRPGRPKWTTDAYSFLGFGSNLTTFNLLNFFARNLDNILIGRFWGESALGIYDRAYKLLLMPLSQIVIPISRVALPLLARTQTQPDMYRRAFCRILEVVLLLTYPVVLFALSAHQQLIVTVLGPRWEGVADIFAILALGALLAPISHGTGWLLISQDRTREMRNWGALSSVAFVLSFLAGLPWGPIGVATSYIAVGLVQGPLLWIATTRSGFVSTRLLFLTICPYWICCIPTISGILYLQSILNPGVSTLAILLSFSYIVFTLALLVFPAGRKTLKQAFGQIQRLIPKRNAGASSY